MAEAVKKKRSPLKGKGGLVAVVALVVLGIWLFLDFQRPVTDPNAPKAFESLGVRSDEVTGVEVKRANSPFKLVKQGSGWTFETPGSYPANPESVKTWLKGLLDDTDARKLEGGAADLAKFGLDKPQIEATFRTRGGSRTLQVGKDFRMPSETKASLYYAREAGSGRLFMLPAGEVEGLRDKEIGDLRDKRLMVLDDEKNVRGITVQRENGRLELTRQAVDRWSLVQPFAAAAAADEVSTLINRLKNAEADSFVEDAAANLIKYGLDKPRLTAQVRTTKGPLGVVFGKSLKDGKVYAAREGSNAVMLVSKVAFEDVAGQATPAKLRDRQLTTLDRDRISFIEVRNPHGTVRLRKIADKQWLLADEKDPKKNKANTERVQSLVDRITGPATAHVEEVPRDLAKYGLDKPVIAVTFNDGQATSQVFAIGNKTAGGNYFARGAPNAVFEVSGYVFDDLNAKPAVYQQAAK